MSCILGVLFYCAFPFLLNIIIAKDNPTSFDVVGEDKDWLNFWAVYIGASIPIIVLIFSQRYNSKQNRRTLKYTEYQNWINSAKQAIILSKKCFNQLTLDRLTLLIINKCSESELHAFHVQLLTDVNTATDALRTTFLGMDDKVEKEYILHFEDMRIIFSALVADMIWFYHFCSSHHELDIEIFKKKLSEYSSTWQHKGISDIRIERIAKRFNYDYLNKKEDILHDLSNASIIGHLFHGPSDEIIKYEITKADNILNGTEQNK